MQFYFISCPSSINMGEVASPAPSVKGCDGISESSAAVHQCISILPYLGILCRLMILRTYLGRAFSHCSWELQATISGGLQAIKSWWTYIIFFYFCLSRNAPVYKVIQAFDLSITLRHWWCNNRQLWWVFIKSVSVWCSVMCPSCTNLAREGCSLHHPLPPSRSSASVIPDADCWWIYYTGTKHCSKIRSIDGGQLLYLLQGHGWKW